MVTADSLRSDLTASMRAGEALKTSVLRMLLSELNYKKINVQRELTEADILEVVTREVKKRREAIDSFTAGGRTEQAASETLELKILQAYLPVMMTEAEIKKEVIKLIERLSDEDKKEFGKVMRQVSPVFKGKAEGAVVAKVVKELVSN
jgi:uncharacterized protein